MAKRTRKPTSGGSGEAAKAASESAANPRSPEVGAQPGSTAIDGGPKHLEDLLLALQKSFSRVSMMSTRSVVGEDNARALITGSVDFDLVAKFDLVYKQGDTGVRITREPVPGGLAGMAFETLGIQVGKPTPDQLRLNADGAIQLHLKGKLSTDVRVVEADVSRGAAEPGATEPRGEDAREARARERDGEFNL